LIHFDLGEKNESMGPFLTNVLSFLAGENAGSGDAASRFKEGMMEGPFSALALSLVDNNELVVVAVVAAAVDCLCEK
jgi:hypothetical protein